MRITSKGQVTIPIDIREKAGLFPDAEVNLEFDVTFVRIVRVEPENEESRGSRIVAHMRGQGDVALSTDEIMELTRDA